ncbi:MAG: aldehyde ferredoxin oxidoreductase C-terminal domain-containing protein [Promethearchaeota archaeon]
MPKIVRINLETKEIKTEDIEKGHPLEYFGGRSLSAKILMDELDPKTEPLSKENKLIFASGLLCGTYAPNSGRLSIGSKSPLTNGIKESNVGGKAPTLLCRSDIKALIFENSASNWQILKIQDEEIKLLNATQYVGINNYELDVKLCKEFGKNIGIFSIGIAGEKKLKAASIASMDLEGYPSRHAGRGGLGAVMGSKKLKAVIIVPPEKSKILYSDKKSFQQVAIKWGKNLQESKKVFSKFGTLIGLMGMNSVHGLPTQNFRKGSFENADKISGEALHEYLTKNNGKYSVACSPGCMIRCSNIVYDKEGKHITSSLEYETVALNGSNLLIDDIEKLARIDHICDDYGLDTIEIGNALAVFMEAGILKWSDAEGCINLLNGLKKNEENALKLGMGAVLVGSSYNISRVAHVKGQGLPGYDPRTFKGMGVTYITSPMGADHTAGAAIIGRTPDSKRDYGKLHTPEHKVELSKKLQIFTMILDSMGQCYFVGPYIDNIGKLADMLNARYGWALSTNDLIEMGKKWLKIEHEFNLHARLKEPENLPDFMIKEKLSDQPERSWDIDSNEISSYWNEL